MSAIKSIRERLGVTQAVLAEGMGCTQGNVWHYEHGQAIPSDAAKRLIAYAASIGHVVTYDEIYGPVSTPKAARAKTPQSTHGTANGEPKDSGKPTHGKGGK
jgi:putative transcriptional regulator